MTINFELKPEGWVSDVKAYAYSSSLLQMDRCCFGSACGIVLACLIYDASRHRHVRPIQYSLTVCCPVA